MVFLNPIAKINLHTHAILYALEGILMCGVVQYMWILLKVSGFETNTFSFAPTFCRITNIMLVQDD